MGLEQNDIRDVGLGMHIIRVLLFLQSLRGRFQWRGLLLLLQFVVVVVNVMKCILEDGMELGLERERGGVVVAIVGRGW